MTTQKGGRRTKLTPEIQDRIYASLRAGNYACVAARLAGIAESTFYDWLEQGKRARSGRFSEFSESVMRAELEAEVAGLKNWQAQIPTDWRACKEFLERRFLDRWRLPKDGEQASEDEPRRPQPLSLCDGHRGLRAWCVRPQVFHPLRLDTERQ
jgi:transposase-like protein